MTITERKKLLKETDIIAKSRYELEAKLMNPKTKMTFEEALIMENYIECLTRLNVVQESLIIATAEDREKGYDEANNIMLKYAPVIPDEDRPTCSCDPENGECCSNCGGVD